MIKEESFSQSWLQKFRNQESYKRINPPVFEKMIFALLLLEKLAESGIDFIFKGGTSLILLLDDADRFSVDIDILTTNSKKEIDQALAKIIDNSNFTQYEYDERRSTSSKIPKAHYKISFQSEYINNTHVILDILFEENNYPNILNLPVDCSWISTEEPFVNVKVPCVNSILGDKMTAFAPNTTGIPYNKGKHIEIIKQLHDVGKLIDKMDNLSLVNASFQAIVQKEIVYRNLTISPQDVCDDIVNTALLIARREKNTGIDKMKMTEIQSGINGFKNYLIYGRFLIEDAIIASAKAALLATMIKHNRLEQFNLYENQDLTSLEITHTDYNFLNRFKKTLKPAFYYWYQALLYNDHVKK